MYQGSWTCCLFARGWSRLFSGEGFSREYGGIGRNACLNYGYAVLRGNVVRAITIAELLPSLGIFHRHWANTFGLADDLIEPFRPVIDFAVSLLDPYGPLTTEM